MPSYNNLKSGEPVKPPNGSGPSRNVGKHLATSGFLSAHQSVRLWALPVYALTSICPMEYTKRVESVFEVIAEPNRRAILSLLVSSQQSVGEIERQLRMPQPTVSKHLRVLREGGFVESTVDAQRRLYRLKPEPLQQVDAWPAPFRRFWSAHIDALERNLDHMDQSRPTKRKTTRRRRGPNRGRDKGETK
jgi:DNA-binding transcriptional ArsR family regulator